MSIIQKQHLKRLNDAKRGRTHEEMYGKEKADKIRESIILANSGIPSRKLPPGEGAFNYMYRYYKRNAEKRNIEWQLSQDEFRLLTKGNCFYCGEFPKNTIVTDKKLKRFNGDYIHNGIDRLNNKIEYVYDNCVSCCKICNNAKRTMSITEFKQWLCRVCEISIGENYVHY